MTKSKKSKCAAMWHWLVGPVLKFLMRRSLGKMQHCQSSQDIPEMACVGCWQEVDRKAFKCGCPDGVVGKWKHADDITPAEWGKIHSQNTELDGESASSSQ